MAKKKDLTYPKDINVETLHNKLEVKIYRFKKTKHYIALEVGFHNPTRGYVEFTPKEIYIDEENSYSKLPLSLDKIQEIEDKKPGIGILPLALGIGFGIASIATSRSHSGTSFGLGMTALSMGGAFILTKALENQVKQNKLITFENNSITGFKRIPPGMTLGGYLFFPAVKNPKSITLIAKSKRGHFEKKVFPIYTKSIKKKKRRKY